MGKKATISGIVFSVIGLVSAIIMFSIFSDMNNQRQQELNNDLVTAKQNLDAAIRHDVRNCLANPTTQCDNELEQVAADCKKQGEQDVPACTDNTISSYFSIRGISYNNPPYNSASTSDQNPVLPAENVIDSCIKSPSETCNYQMANLYQNCSTVPTQLNQCNTKVVLYLIKNAVILDSSGKIVFYQKGLSEPDGRIIPRSLLVPDEQNAYFNDEPSHDPRLLYQQLNPSNVHPKWDVNTAGLNVLAFCQGSTSASCDEAMATLSGFCYDQPALFPVCGDERIAEYLIKQNLADKIIKQPY